MKEGFILLFAALLLFSCCVEEPQETPAENATSTTTPADASTTFQSTSSTSPTPQETLSTTSTTPPEIEEDPCLEEQTSIGRDNCYLNLALSNRDPLLCERINRSSAKSICIEQSSVEQDGRSTTINGYVVNDTTGKGIRDVRVYAFSQTYEEEVAEDATSPKGFYEMDVPARDTYYIVAVLDGREFRQEVYAKKGWTHEIWFRMA